jgi:hypothetical protein
MHQKIKLTVYLSLLLTCLLISRSHAQNTEGYSPAATISDADAFNYANQYKAVHGKNGTPVSGGVITRDAINQILSNSNCNAITYKLCMDTTGRVAPADVVFIILSGANVVDKNGQKTVIDIGAQKYTPNNWCPPSCMKFMIRDPNTGELVPQE